jgi:hypothetical protein
VTRSGEISGSGIGYLTDVGGFVRAHDRQAELRSANSSDEEVESCPIQVMAFVL